MVKKGLFEYQANSTICQAKGLVHQRVCFGPSGKVVIYYDLYVLAAFTSATLYTIMGDARHVSSFSIPGIGTDRNHPV